eukprot:scaffold26796_cov23-Cyclotella_meneghiniana.AAC.1
MCRSKGIPDGIEDCTTILEVRRDESLRHNVFCWDAHRLFHPPDGVLATRLGISNSLPRYHVVVINSVAELKLFSADNHDIFSFGC